MNFVKSLGSIRCQINRGHAREDELLAFFVGKTAKWQIPDDVIFVDAIPLGGTGKMQKTKLREMLADYRLPTH
jgi:acyl-CoA synthetase (AMP-forming)/AMP-acid ligase II